MSYTFDAIKLEKGMYNQSGKSFTEVLESLDPSENYAGGALEGLDAFQRQLKRFSIRVKGPGSDSVDKFFQSSDAAVLFPEYVARAVRSGMEEENILPDICATITRFDGIDYRAITSDADKKMQKVAEGAAIPETKIVTQENLIKLNKRGRMLVASYESIRFQRIDLFSVILRQIGSQLMKLHAEDAVDVILNGDGNANPAQVYEVGTAPISGTSGDITYDQLVEFWSLFDPFEMNTLLISGDAMLKVLKMAEFQNPMTGLNFQGTGKLKNPLGASLIRSSAVPNGSILGLDRRYALEMVRASDVSVEYDKLIDRQLERAAITSVAGFAKICKEASKKLEI